MAAVFLAPLLLLGSAELILRLTGYGYPTNFFLPLKIEGKDYYVPNDDFGYRFFPKALARTPAQQRMLATKPPGTYRIFVFGESAALGDPDPSFGAWRYLQTLLRGRFPGAHLEVICTAMTAINSHAILPIARECARHDGDLWIIMMGNNEMVGPFGGATVFGSRAPPAALVRANLALKSTRLGQWLDAMLQRRGAETPKSWTGLEMFRKQEVRHDDPRRLRAYENFKENLDDILRAGHGVGVPIILCTVGSNLKDCAPFGSLHPQNFGATQLAGWDAAWREGVSRQSKSDYSGALAAFTRAAAIDDHFAELQFRMAACDLAMTNTSRALQEFEAARDDDTLAFRADTRINQVIRDEANAHANDGVKLLDAARILADASPGHVPGDELFYEHVHLTFRGNYLLGRALADQTLPLLRQTVTARGKSAWATEDECERRLAVSWWDRYRNWQDILSRVSEAPFTGQATHDDLVRRCEAQLSELKIQGTSEDTAQIRQLYKQALALAPEDGFVHFNFAQYLGAEGDLPGATAEAQRVCDLLPQNLGQYYDIGNLLVLQDKIDEAVDYYSRALAMRADFANALNAMGLILQNRQKPDVAARYFKRALRSNPNSIDACINLGFLAQMQGDLKTARNNYDRAARLQPGGPADYLSQGSAASALGQHAQAIAGFGAAVQLKPDSWQAHYLWGQELAALGRTDDARFQFSESARYRPDFALAHLNLGLMLEQQGQREEALREFKKTLAIDPNEPSARTHLDALQAKSLRAP